MDYFFDNRICYRKNEFKPGRKTLVFVHGLSSNFSAWFRFEKKFSRKYNILMLDLRGHGKSLRYKNYADYSINKFSEDLYNIFIHEKIKKATMICHSFGVFVGLDFISKHQNLLNSAVLLNPTYAPAPNGLSKVKQIIASTAKAILSILPNLKEQGSHFDYSYYEGTGDYNLRRLRRDIFNTGIKPFVFSLINSFSFNSKNQLKKIKIPILLIQGDKDKILRVRTEKFMNKEIKNSKLVILKDADHLTVLNNFREVSKLIENFI